MIRGSSQILKDEISSEIAKCVAFVAVNAATCMLKKALKLIMFSRLNTCIAL